MKKNKVYITAYESISALGIDCKSAFLNLKEGKRPITVPAEDDKYRYPYFKVDSPLTGNSCRASDIAFHLLDRVISGGKLANKTFPVFFSTSTGDIDETERVYKSICEEGLDYPLFERHFFGKIVNDVKERYGDYVSQSFTFSTACSSSAQALFQAYRFIGSGVIKRAFVIGIDVLSGTTNIGFDSLKLLSHSGTRPLTTERNGLTLGEGGGILVLDSEPGDEPVAEIVGIHSNSDGYHISSPDPEGKCQRECIVQSLEQASLEKEQIDYISAHGTGTVMNDEIEHKVIKGLFGKGPVMTSLKAFIGHTLGASAAVELALSFEMMKHNLIPQPEGYSNSMDEELIPNSSVERKVTYFVKNSFGFGGNNVSLVVKNLF